MSNFITKCPAYGGSQGGKRSVDKHGMIQGDLNSLLIVTAKLVGLCRAGTPLSGVVAFWARSRPSALWLGRL